MEAHHADAQHAGSDRRRPSAPQAQPRMAVERREIGAPPLSHAVPGLSASAQSAAAWPGRRVTQRVGRGAGANLHRCRYGLDTLGANDAELPCAVRARDRQCVPPPGVAGSRLRMSHRKVAPGPLCQPKLSGPPSDRIVEMIEDLKPNAQEVFAPLARSFPSEMAKANLHRARIAEGR